MRTSTRRLPHWWIGAGVLAAALVAAPLLLTPSASLSAQEDSAAQAFTVRAHKYAFEPARLEVHQDDLVKITLRAEDIPHSFTVDAYRISKRAGANATVTFEFRADRAGTFPFYCDLRIDEGCRKMHGDLVVLPR